MSVLVFMVFVLCNGVLIAQMSIDKCLRLLVYVQAMSLSQQECQDNVGLYARASTVKNVTAAK